MIGDVDAAIAASGGRIVFSTTINTSEPPRTPNATTRSRCGSCGERGHIARRCNGPGQPPRPLAVAIKRPRVHVTVADRRCSKCGELGHDARRHNGRAREESSP